MEIVSLLRDLSEVTGISGYEEKVVTIIKKAAGPFIDNLQRDPLGNVVLFKKGEGSNKRPRVMLAAHMDEIGLMVAKIEPNGFLRFTTIGGIDLRTMPGQEVIVGGKELIHGVIGSKPPHLQEPEERKKAITLEELYIDTGYSEEYIKKMVKIGDTITIQRKLQVLAGNRVAGKALDDRAGVAVLIACLQELAGLRHQADVYAVATVQEEVGIRGAIVSTYGIYPDIGIAIDVCHGDMPGVAEDESSPLDQGPALGLGPHVHRKIFANLNATAQKVGIPIQIDPSPNPRGTDAWGMQIARDGVPTALVSIPLRYMHTSVETLSIKDLLETSRLLAAFIQKIEPAFVEGLACF